MAVRIRLKRMGRKKAPHYRVVVADSRSPRDGRFVETLGYYKPLSNPARLVLDIERVDYWIGQGASPSGTVKSLINKARTGGDEIVAVGPEDLEARRQAEHEALAKKRAAEKAAAVEAAAAATAAAEAPAAPPEEAAEGGEEAPAAEDGEEAPAAEAAEEPAAEAEEAEKAE